MAGGRPKGSKDSKKRTRQSMTEQHKQARRDGINRKANGNSVMTNYIIRTNEAKSTQGDTNDATEQADHVVALFSDNFADTSATPIQTRVVAANVDVDEEGMEKHYYNEKDSQRKGIQQEYLEMVHSRLKLECQIQEEKNKKKKDDEKKEKLWLIEYLKDNGWWIRKEDAHKIVRQLKIKLHHVAYYRDIRIWLPELQYGRECLPCCPFCKTNRRVTVHCWQIKHHGRMIIGLTQTYYLIGRRYRCEACKEQNVQLKKSVSDAFESDDVEVELEQGLQYTFMGWNRNSLPLFPKSLSEEFPAFLTHKSGVDKLVLDLIRPLIDKGIRPDAISDILLEMHSKEYSKCYIRYEEDNKHKSLYGAGYPNFSEFDDEFGYRGKVPTGGYLQSVYIKFHNSIRRHLTNEVKKRGAERLSIDVSYKSAKHMCQYKGEPIFKGLVTATNEYGEIRMQFHVISDSHEQIEAAIQNFVDTTNAYGYPLLQLVSTDNPTRDKAYFLNKFPSLRAQQEKLNSLAPEQAPQSNDALQLVPYERNHVSVISTPTEISRFVTAMRNIAKNTTKTVALDAEWKVDLNTNGRISKSHRVGLIQLCFLDEDGVYKVGLLQTGSLKTLPSGLVALLKDDTIAIVGVQVGGDLAKIGRDFSLSSVINDRRRESIINLGKFARVRDVIQNGKAKLEDLCTTVLKQRIEKQTHLRFSDWNRQCLTPDQIKYAALDALVSLRIFDSIKHLPDLNRRLSAAEAIEGKIVDVVPRSGSIACMATRAATGRILAASPCASPAGIAPKSVKPGANHVVVHVEKIYSPAMKIPRYKKIQGEGVVSMIDFKDQAVVLPITMLKEHVASDSIRHTPVNGEREHPAPNELRVSLPASLDGGNAAAAESSEAVNMDLSEDNRSTLNNVPTLGEDECDEEQDTSYSITEVEDFEDLTALDCENLRCAIFSASASQSGAPPMKCKHLDEPPNPSSIKDQFSSVLGDPFHAMDRPNIPVKHESKKAYKNALKNAFFIWNEEKMEPLVRHMKSSGMSDEEIEAVKYFKPTLFHDCVERIVPAPKILYWRVRAVFVLYGGMLDSKTKAPLFNERAWKKANNVLKEILAGYYSDPPGVPMYMKKIRKDGSVEKNKYEMDVIESMRGTPRTEAVHKGLVSTFGGWNMGVEMSSCVLAERRHRYNHKCSERRRVGFPVVGHYDTWLVDKIQNLVHKNHGRLIYPDWSNASDYKETNESFDTAAIHSKSLHVAVNKRWDDLSKEEKKRVKLTSDQKYMCSSMGTHLPFLPFATEMENRAYNKFVIEGIPKDEEEAAIAWCKFVDGVDVFPKLPVHIRNYHERWERNQRVKDSVRNAKSGNEKLAELNAALVPLPVGVQNVAQQHAIPAQPLPVLTPQAQTAEPYTVTARMSVGILPQGAAYTKRVRGKDVKARTARKCKACLQKKNGNELQCPGRGGYELCSYFCGVCVMMKNDANASNCLGRGNGQGCEYYCSVCVKKKRPTASTCPGRIEANLCVSI